MINFLCVVGGGGWGGRGKKSQYLGCGGSFKKVYLGLQKDMNFISKTFCVAQVLL